MSEQNRMADTPARESLSPEEREVLRDAVRGALASLGDMPADAAATEAAPALRAAWQELLDLGVVALDGVESPGSVPVAPILGGATELQAVFEELGRAHCAAPLADAWLTQRLLAPLAAQRPEVAALMAAVRGGEVVVALALGHRDGDPQAGGFTAAGGRVSGALAAWQGSAIATHILVALQPAGWALVAREAAGVAWQAVPSFGKLALASLVLAEAPAEWIVADAEPGFDPALLAQWAGLARAHGAARRAFEMAVEYAGERRQFGQPIGRFQAIQHKLADVYIGLEGVRLALAQAARALDDERRPEYWLASAAVFAAPALIRASLEIQHTFGAIGYAEEHEAPRHFRQVHRDCAAFGGARRARRRLAAEVFGQPGFRFPEHDLGEEGNRFRLEVRQWLADYWTPERRAAFDARPFHGREYDHEFALALGRTGWNGLAWPREFGGQGRGPMEQIAFIEEMERAEAPRAGAAVQANALMLYGTPGQQARYLPEMLRGEAMHGMGYSEPGAGSDLASLRTRAIRTADGWTIQGQKIWTTTWWGKYMFLAARTDAEAKPAHAGISMFIVPMDAPGITINQATTLYDGSFANIFYDDVKLEPDALVGELNGGWKVLTGALAAERGLIGGGIVCKVMRWFEQALEILAQSAGDAQAPLHDPVVRDRLAGFAAEIEVGRLLMLHCAELAVDGITPPEYGAISKVFSGELMERFGEALLEILGMRATLSQGAPRAWANGSFEQRLRHSLMWVISIGTNEIQRSLIAQRGLRLPR
ncbi:MAG: acyl-CoA dehydrogenase [Pigmentiphaga sp.]|nr:acyl-CoA dehydrogenase [Pigmentiphaga sp.]